jgi:hypothetical protein
VVFGSIGRGSRWDFAVQRIVFKKSGSVETGSFTYVRSPTITVPVDIEEGEKKATLFAVRLPPGRYELFDVFFALGNKSFGAERPFVIPFEVAEGRATYLGEFLSFSVLGKNFIGAVVYDGAYFVVSDQLQRDQTLLIKRYPEIRTLSVDNVSRRMLEANVPSFRAH